MGAEFPGWRSRGSLKPSQAPVLSHGLPCHARKRFQGKLGTQGQPLKPSRPQPEGGETAFSMGWSCLTYPLPFKKPEKVKSTW